MFKSARRNSLALLLAALAVVAPFAALTGCSSGKDGGDAQTSSTSAISESAGIESAESESGTSADESAVRPEIMDLNGYEFRIYSHINSQNDVTMFEAESENGEIINDTLYARNRKVEEDYNIKILFTLDESALQKINTLITAGEDFADVTFVVARDVFTSYDKNSFIDLKSIESLALDTRQPWWDSRIIDEFDIGGRLLCLTGDFTLRNPLCTMIIMYNKTLYSQFDFDDPYALVSDEKWTFDKMMEQARYVTGDVNGDGINDENDNWGLISEHYAPYYFFIGSGMKTLKKDGDTLELQLNNEKVVGALTHMLEKCSDKSVACYADELPGQWTTATNMFKNGQVLFYSAAFGAVVGYRDMEDDFGVLPIPAYTEDQNGYYSWVSLNDSPLVIPSTVSDPERSGLVLNALGYESGGTLRSAFYTTLLSDKVMRDEKSVEMLDIIWNSKTYDIDTCANITTAGELSVNLAKKGSSDVMSAFAKAEEKAKSNLEKILA